MKLETFLTCLLYVATLVLSGVVFWSIIEELCK